MVFYEVYENAILNYLKSVKYMIATTEPSCLLNKRIGRDTDFVDGITEVHGAEAKPAGRKGR